MPDYLKEAWKIKILLYGMREIISVAEDKLIKQKSQPYGRDFALRRVRD